MLPDPANETPLDADASASDLPISDGLVQEVEPIDDSAPESRPEEAGIDDLEPDVVQVGWRANAAELVAPVEEGPIANGAAKSDAGPSSLVSTPTGENAPELVDPFGQGFEEEEIIVDRYADLDGGVFAGCPRVSSEEGRTLASIIDQHTSPQLSVLEVDSIDDRETGDASPQPIDAPVDDVNHAEAADESDLVTKEIATVDDDLPATDKYAEQALANHVIDASSLSNWLVKQTMETLVAGGVETDDAMPVENELSSSEIKTESSESSRKGSAGDEPANDASQDAVSQEEDESAPSFLQVHDGPNINDDRDMIIIDEDKHDGVILTESGDELAHRVEYQQLFTTLRQGQG